MAKRNNSHVGIRQDWHCHRCGAIVSLTATVFAWEAETIEVACVQCRRKGFSGVMWPCYRLILPDAEAATPERGCQGG